jgi:hypothetical protein
LLAALLENLFEHVGDFSRIRAIEFDELAYNFRGRHVDLFNHARELPNDIRILCYQKARRFRKGQNIYCA